MDLQNYHEWIAERQRLLERIKELEAENAELRKRLGEDVVPIKQEPYAMQTLSLQEKVGLFRSLFGGAKMYLLVDGSAKRQGRLVISQSVRMNGVSYAISENSNVQNVLIASSHH